MRKRRLGAVLCAAGAAGLVGAPAPAPAAAVAPGASSPEVVTDRLPQDRRITESSGLASSLRHRGVVWTHNDSGDAARLFAIGPDGATAATVTVAGVTATDWEAIAAFRDLRGRPSLLVADIGDGAAERPFVQLVVIREPALRNGTVRPERVLRLTYPTGPVDAEAVLVDPDGRRAFIVSKGIGSRIFQVPPALWAATTGPTVTARASLVARAGVPLLFVTDGVMGPGGHPVVRTYGELAVLPPIADDVTGGSLPPLATLRLPAQRQGEGLTLLDGRMALVGSEGVREPLLRVGLPDEFVAVLGGSPAGSPGASTGSAGSPSPAAEPAGARLPASEVAWGVALGAVLAAALAVGRRRLRAR